MSISPNDDSTGRELLLSFRQSYDSYQEYVGALHNPNIPHIYRLVGLHSRLYQTDAQYKALVRDPTTTDVPTNQFHHISGISSGYHVNNNHIMNIANINGSINTGTNGVSKHTRRDRTLKAVNKPDILCAHTCTNCKYKIRYDNTQDLCRRHMLRYRKRHTHCNYDCEVYNYVNHDCKQQQGVPFWCELAAHVYQDEPDQYSEIANRHKLKELNTPGVLKLIAEYCIEQYEVCNNRKLFSNNQYSESLCELVRHINPSLSSKILSNDENNTNEVNTPHLNVPANTITLDPLPQHHVTDRALTAIQIPEGRNDYILRDSSILTATPATGATATDSSVQYATDSTIDSDIVYVTQRITRSHSKLSTTSEQTNITTSTVRVLSQHTDMLTLGSNRESTAFKPLHVQRKLTLPPCTLLPSISTYLKCWTKIEAMCTEEYGSLSSSTVSQCIVGQQDATRVNNLRFEYVKLIMKRYGELVSTVYKTHQLKKQWRGIELLLCWSNLSAAEHMTELVADARITFANMLVEFDVEHGEMFNANTNLTRQSDMPDQLVNYAYMLFVLKQLHQPKHHSILKWLQKKRNLQSQLDYKRYIDGKTQLGSKLKLYTMKDIIGMESVCITNTKTMKYCSQCKRISKCQCGMKFKKQVYDYELITTGMCKVAIFEYLQCNILANNEIVQLHMFDDVIKDVVTQFQSMEEVGLHISEWQAYFATHVIYAHTLYGTQPIQKVSQYQQVIEYMKNSFNSFLQIGHVEVIGEYAATLRLAEHVEDKIVLNGILYILAQVNQVGEVITSETISSRVHKHVNFKPHVQWCAINALIPSMRPITLT